MTERPTIAYQPALDGLRAGAVIAVILFHGGVPGFDGGYLGVSVFFTLSGFLITSLLVHEHERTGRIDLARFYARRVRRLLPASAVCLIGIMLIGALTGLFDGVASLRAHLFGAVFQVANWVFLAGDGSYQDLLARTSGTSSPLEHFWSLAIEEQFYWVWPPVMLLVLTRVPGRRERIRLVGTITAVSMLAAPVIAAVWGPDAAYWSTPARIGEILVGALLGLVVTGRVVPEAVGRLAPAGVGLLAIAVVTFPSSGGPAYNGALPLVALVSAGLILGLQVDGPIRRVLEVGPLVWIGRISYGLYLFHWPIFVLVHPDRVGWSEPVILLVRLVLTLGLSVLSFRLVEQPVRIGMRSAPRETLVGAGVATVALIGVSALVLPSALGDYWVTDTATAEAAAIELSDTPLQALARPENAPATPPSTSDVVAASTTPTTLATPATPMSSTTTATPTVTPTTVMPTVTPPTVTPIITTTTTSTVPPLPVLTRPTRIVVIGDSTANAFGTGLVRWAAERPDLAQVEVVAAPGCGIVPGGERRTSESFSPIEGCDGWLDAFVYPAVERLRPDVVMVMVTSWDIIDRRWDTEAGLTPFDDEFVVRLEGAYDQLRLGLENAGAGRVAFARHPIPDVYWLPAVDAQEEPARHAVLYGVYDRLAVDERVDVIELDRWFSANGLDRDQSVRPDGVHPTPEAATDISERYLGEQLVRIALGVARP